MAKKSTRLSVPRTRGGDPKKIQEWTAGLPGSDRAVVFDIELVYDAGGAAIFQATSAHPAFTGFRVVDADLNLLRDKLQAGIDHVAATSLSDGWAPAILSEVRVKDWGGNDSLRLGIDLVLETVEVREDVPVGNRGETEIRTASRRRVVVQRSITDDFSALRPKSGSLLDPEVRAFMASPFTDETVEAVSRVVLPGEGLGTRATARALQAFGSLLAQRMSWQSTSLHGEIRPEELTSLMSEAVTLSGE